uniref:DUF3307 domain-containing protein n=1 Tax=Streptomyces sp. NBC_00049 TaxID=2903617 RepID=A0AAU2K0Y3_9ACTN
MFASAFVALLADYWVIAAKAVSTFLGVSLPSGRVCSVSVQGSAHGSRLAGVNAAPRSSAQGVAARRRQPALLAHVAVYHLAIAVMLAVTLVLLDLPIGWAGACAGIAFSAVSHGFWDRRWPVKMWMTTTGSREFATATGIEEVLAATSAIAH